MCAVLVQNPMPLSIGDTVAADHNVTVDGQKVGLCGTLDLQFQIMGDNRPTPIEGRAIFYVVAEDNAPFHVVLSKRESVSLGLASDGSNQDNADFRRLRLPASVEDTKDEEVEIKASH